MDLTCASPSRPNGTANVALPIRLAGSLLEERRHVCAFFNSRDEEYRVSLPFVKEGLECGQRAFHLVGAERREDHLQRLSRGGIDTVNTRRTGQLELKDWHDTYLSGGYFDPDRWLGVLEDALAEGPRRGYPLTRFVGHMEWALEDRVGVDRLVEYEARTNYVWPLYRDPVICTYDLARFGANVIVDVMRTHPLIIIGGILQQNPFYVEPDEFLEELRQRGALGAGSADSVV